MSRHRLVKQLNLDEELDDEAFSDEEQDAQPVSYDMDEEQAAQMESGFIAVKSMLGGDTLITDAEIRDALWNFYFDVEQSTDYLLDEHHKREQAEAKRLANGEDEVSQKFGEITLTNTGSDLKPPKLSKLAERAKAAKGQGVHHNTVTQAPAANLPAIEEGQKKPLSKLQQRALASKQAQLSRTTAGQPLPEQTKTPPHVTQDPDPTPIVAQSPLFTSTGQSRRADPQNLLHAIPSKFARTLQPTSDPSREGSYETVNGPLIASLSPGNNFVTPSPDDIVLNARKSIATRARGRSRGP